MLKIKCPSCDRTEIQFICEVMGREGLFQLNEPTFLYKCPECVLYFRRPYFSEKDLQEMYENAETTLWESEAREDFSFAIREIGNRPNPLLEIDVLDVGCYGGQFLLMLPDECKKHGVEISKSGRELCAQRGIDILGSSVKEVGHSGKKFDYITAFDVFEHVIDPLEFFEDLANLVKEDGLLILSTANAQALPWKIMREEYWYYFPDHVSFLSEKWIEKAGKKIQPRMRLVKCKKFSRFPSSIFIRFKQIFKLTVYKLRNIAVSSALSRQKNGAPQTFCWKDHMFVILMRG